MVGEGIQAMSDTCKHHDKRITIFEGWSEWCPVCELYFYDDGVTNSGDGSYDRLRFHYKHTGNEQTKQTIADILRNHDHHL